MPDAPEPHDARAPDAATPTAAAPGQRLPREALHAFAASVFAACGVPPADAELAARILVAADARGHHTHGLYRLPAYAARLQSGAANPAPTMELAVDAGAVAVLDAGEGLGQLAAHRAMELAIGKARVHGVGAVGVRHSNHFGMAMDYTLQATRARCVGLITTNASPAMAPWGGRRKAVGNNPWSIAAPAGRYAPVALDIANTVVARGKIRLAETEGRAIPRGWAADAQGRPTMDPSAALAGLILPMGEHKGYAISFMMDLLAGVLTGAGFGAAVTGSFNPQLPGGRGHLTLALDIAHFMPPADFEARVEALIQEIKAVPPAPGYDGVYYPGELEAQREARSRARGVALPGAVVESLMALAKRLAVDHPY